ncbi:hypothetical protein GQ53DRAFT_743516 [Thozetella sp. PMI_491]|nr:hypothetical protein GQ53DRAFT_743516 [Thozetella sp. PMI_491]
MVLGVASGLIVLTTICFGLRTWVRAKRRVKFGLDDAFLILSFFFLWVYFTLVAIEVVYGGLGKPVVVNYMDDPNILVRFLQILFAIEILSPISLTITKFGVLALYRRLFPTPFIKTSCIVIGCTLIVWCFAVVIPSILQCNPVSKAWSPFMTTGSCSTPIWNWIAWQDAIPEFVTTVLIFGLPMYEISRLSASWRTHIALSAVFIFASLSLISSVVRFVLGFRAHENDTALNYTIDITLDMTDTLLWSHIEQCTAFIAACLPALRPLMVTLARKLGRSRDQKTPAPAAREVPTFGQNMAINRNSPRNLNGTEATEDPQSEGFSERLPVQTLRATHGAENGDAV